MIISTNSLKQTNWYVITGAPCSGKTTLINLLHDHGYKTTIEHARHYLDTKKADGKSIEEIRSHQKEFQLGILDMQIQQEAELIPEDLVFLDRAIPDALAYYRFLNLEVDEKLLAALSKTSYKRIFLLDYLPLVQDYARQEDEAAQKKIHQLLTEVYKSLTFPVIHVPVLSPNERLEFILKNL